MKSNEIELEIKILQEKLLNPKSDIMKFHYQNKIAGLKRELSKCGYEDKRVRKPVSFNQETEAELLAFANSIDFSNWVKKKISEEIRATK